MPQEKGSRNEDSGLSRARELATLDMVNSRAVLDHTQRDAIKQSTSLLRAELARIDAEARRLKALRGELIAQLQINETLLIPIRMLPHDVLSDIFLEVVSRYRAVSRNLGTPAIARVCREWRAIVFRDPRLWTVVNVPYRDDWNESVEAIIEAYLSRSLQLSLHVCARGDMRDPEPYRSGSADDDDASVVDLTISDDDPTLFDMFALRAIQCIAALSAHRWKSLCLSGHRAVFDQQTQLELPILDSITIAARSSYVILSDALTLSFLAHAPCLRKIVVDVRIAFYDLPKWETLKHATYLLRECSRAEFNNIDDQLCSQEQLETLAVIQQDCDTYDPVALRGERLFSGTFMPHLATITVSGAGHSILTALLAPALQMLVVHDAYQDCYDEEDPGVISFIMRMDSQCALRSLRVLKLVRVLLDQNAGMDLVFRCLERLPSLESLHIESSRHLSDARSILRYELLVWLTRTAEAPARLPNLTNLVLYFGKERHKGAKSRLRNLLASRETCGSAEGVSLKALTRFRTDISKELQIG
ncbi:uncharacterized protein SCHCODRAFT_02534233 [Schizophyllum commune H4-8]|nr:uncharacterized protein SCHCODRAFT_02534233 [Schizophyllum commune H4-8]KAI5897228.1 hypothetical protein SCHCODRAFT_02534233 [Schizophyllum commune H4-8]